MLTTFIPVKHLQQSGRFVFFVGFLTTIGLTVFHFNQRSPFLLDLVLPPLLSALLFIGLLVLIFKPETVNVLLPLSLIGLEVLLCIPAWYFTSIAWQDPALRFVDIFPPIASVILPLAMGCIVFLKTRVAQIIIASQWFVFTTPIAWYLLSHPEELSTPRGMEILVILGPVAIMMQIFLTYSRGIDFVVSSLNRDKTDLKTLSETDSLTGLFNRRRGEQLLTTCIELERLPFSIIMFDIDHFKKINDQFGHSAGDVILKGVVDCCVEKIRREDFFVRWGGEEFIIILTNTRMQGAYLIAEKLRLALVQKIWPNVSK